MTDDTKRSQDTNRNPQAVSDQTVSNASYVAPTVTDLGSLEELTLGSHRHARTDGVFQGSLFN